MKKIMITGALGQIGTELTSYLADIYGRDNILITDRVENTIESIKDIRFENLDVTDGSKMFELAKDFKADTIINLAAILSARGESMPQATWKVNIDGVVNALEVARELNMQVFVPSSIAAFGASTPFDNTPQVTIQRPNTMYGVTKVAGELLCDYYFNKFGVDVRGVRYPGIISNKTLPGAGTTDYAVHIYYDAIKNKEYTSYIAEGTYMDMLYIPDALKAVADLMEAPADKLIDRNAFNITAMSLAPEMIEESIKKVMPEFVLKYDVDPVRQKIAQSWPNSIDDSEARKQWNWKPEYDLDTMTKDMLEKLAIKLK